MSMKCKGWLTASFIGALCAVPIAQAHAGANVLFDISARTKQLKDADYAFARQSCLSVGENNDAVQAPEPIDALKETEGYGSDNRAEDFSYFVMAQGGRALAGDAKAAQGLKDGLLLWAKANAIAKSKESHDTYYAMKRVLLPVIVNYSIVMDDMTQEQRAQVDAWLEPLVMRVGKYFGGDVDVNNHRLLADSVQMAWGALKDNKDMFNMGMHRYKAALKDMRPDGTLPLETRRGARATWYMRHALTSLVVIAEIAQTAGEDVYELSHEKRTLDTMMGAFLDMVNTPLFALPYAAENYIPGPSEDYMVQDDGFLKRRPNKRHYMAFAEAYLSHGVESFNQQRLNKLMSHTALKERPLLDDYVGGNATCFFWQPDTQKVTP